MAGIIATRVICLADERVNLRRPRRIDPVNESPRPVMSGSFTKGTVHLTGLTHLAFRLSSTVFVGCLPRHTLPPLAWSRGFHRASGTTQPSDDSWNTASHFACAYRVTSLGVIRGSQEPSWGHAQIFRTVPSANTLVRWVNENAFAPIVRARPCPTFGRPVRPWGSPLDYGPVLLRIPFGSRLAAGTLSSEACRAVAPGPSWLCPAFACVPV